LKAVSEVGVFVEVLPEEPPLPVWSVIFIIFWGGQVGDMQR
jgi:hypothetical protein